MKFLRNLIIFILILFIIVFVVAYFLVAAKGKDFICAQAKAAIGKEVRIDSISLMPPYTLSVKGLTVEGLVSVGSLSVEPSISALMAGKIGINKVVVTDPKITIIRYPGNRFNFSDMLDKIQSQQPKEGKENKKPPEIYVKEIYLKNGAISLDDKDVNVSYAISPLDASIITSLLDLKTRFTVEAQALSAANKKIGSFHGNGWVNILKKDMDASFELSGVDITAFNPYVKSPKPIAAGTLVASAKAVSQSNDMAVNGHVETQGIQFAEQTGGDKIAEAFGKIPNVLTGAILGKSGNASFDFSIRTKFDHPQLEGLAIKADIFKGVMQGVMSNPKEAAQQFKEIGKGFDSVGKDYKKQFKDLGKMFSGKQQEEQAPTPTPTTTPVESSTATQAPAATGVPATPIAPENTAPIQSTEPQPVSKTEEKVSNIVTTIQTLGSLMSQSHGESSTTQQSTQMNQTPEYETDR